MSDHASQSAHPRGAPSPTADSARQLVDLAAAAGGLAHEIRNPLSTLKVNLQLLAEDWRDIAAADPATADLVRRSTHRIVTMVREVDRLARILDDFLRFVGKHELNRRRCDLRELLGELADFVEPQAAMQSVRIERQWGDAAVICDVDSDLIRIAVSNLLVNALQAMPDGGSLTIRAAASPPAGADAGAPATCGASPSRIAIEVADTGVGVPPDRTARIFEAYFSTRPGGTGLGLATARRIVREHGGELSVRSNIPQGAVFTMELPGHRA